MQFNQITSHPATQAIVSAAVVMPLVLGAFFALEPAVVKGVQSDSFTVEQEITGEIAFETMPNNVEMDGSIQGISGGVANGTSTFAINTNNPAGYTVTIEFENSAQAMQANSGSGFIPNLGDDGGIAWLDFDDTSGVAATAGAFGFTVTGPNTAEFYQNNGGTCSEAGAVEATTCWAHPDTASDAEIIVDSSTTADAEVHNIHFRVVVPGNPTPALELGIYTATGTLTATEKT